MRKPSPRALSNRVTLYRAVRVQDEDGGEVVTYGAPLAADVPCSVQPADPERFLDPATRRLIQKTLYDVILADDYSLAADDKLVWVDNAGAGRSLFALGSADQAGKGGCFVVSTEERR